MSVQKQPHPSDLRYLKFVNGRAHGLTDEQLVSQLAEPDIDSPQTLYRRLHNDRYPVCAECGAAPVEDVHCEPPTVKRRRRARQGGGEGWELPPPAAATHLLHEVLRCLQRDVDRLSHRRDYLKDGRFEAEHVLSGERGEAWRTHRRGDQSEEAWRKFCEEHGADPSQDEFAEPFDSVQPAGAEQYPPEPLTQLIAVYIPSGYPVDLLLNRLHPDPEAIDLGTSAQLKRYIDDDKVGLKKAARTVARLVRGGTIKTGRQVEGMSSREEDARAYIQERRREGASDGQVLEELRAGHGFRRPMRLGVTAEVHPWPDITISDVRRVGNL